jgi:hypothetical protein
MTGLGDFSPLGRMFTLGYLFYVCYVNSPNCWPALPMENGYKWILTKYVWVLQYFHKIIWSQTYDHELQRQRCKFLQRHW